MKNRYSEILEIIDHVKPRSIVEIGTWNGRNAVNMIMTAQKYHPDEISYIGYDLFETATPQTDADEFNVKPHPVCASVLEFIKQHCPSVPVNLIKGNTRQTLNPLVADFVFIDGGHSIDTIDTDYEAVKGSAVIVLDDFYVPDEDGKMPDIHKMGCNQLVSKLLMQRPLSTLRCKDPVNGGGYTKLVVVT